MFRDSSTGEPFEITTPTPPAEATAEPTTELRVYITGEVNNPGVYAVCEGDRLADVVTAAGGATDAADLTKVNLAIRVSDEQQYHIPKKGEVESRPPFVPQGTPTPDADASGKIDLNSAIAKLLETLPGIGEVKAQSIIRYRESNGSFSKVDDLLAVPGIGTATLEAIRDLVEVR